jgi:hypothetical protein
MTRLLIEHDGGHGRGGEPGSAGDEDMSRGRSGSVRLDDSGRAHAGRPRESSSGRRSLTGLEFRRQRSI